MAFTDRLANRGSISTGYEIEYSVLLDGNHSRGEITQTGGDRKTHTISFWHKRGTRGNYTDSGAGEAEDTSNDMWGTSSEGDTLRFNTSDLAFFHEGGTGSSLQTDRTFRDYAAWYHFVVAVDTTQQTAANRIKIYVNGIQETSFSAETYPDQNDEFKLMQNSQLFSIGAGHSPQTVPNACGYYADFHIIDGAQKAATDFGEFDEDSGIWKPKEYTGDFNIGDGTNGAHYKFEGTAEGTGSGSTGLDSSGNSNNMNFENQVGGCTDTPTNNFCVMNMAFKDDINNTATYDLTSGLTKLTVPSATSVAWGPLPATFQLSSGKWYWEMKWDSGTTFLVGVMNSDADISSIWTYCTMYRPSNGNKYIDNVITSYGSSQSTGDIIGIALDLDNETLQAYVNNSSEGAAFGLGTITKERGYYVPIVWYGDTGESSMNFGGHTAMSISSAESDANGYGAFEYAPPNGFYALCTKNLAELG